MKGMDVKRRVNPADKSLAASRTRNSLAASGRCGDTPYWLGTPYLMWVRFVNGWHHHGARNPATTRTADRSTGMVAALVPSSFPASSLTVIGFTQVPNAVLMDTALSRDARFLYTLLLQHARPRTGYVVRVGYARLCTLMDAGEDLVRRVMRELVAAGLVEQTRRGRGLVNTYRLLVTAPSRPRQERDQDPGETGFSVEEQRIEEDEGGFEYSNDPSPLHLVEQTLPVPTARSVAAPVSSSHPAPRSVTPSDPVRDAILVLIGDFRRELGDRATIGSTTSRALNLYRQSGAAWEEFVAAVYSARAMTQARTSAIKKRDEQGVNKMPYMLAVLTDRLGLREAPREGAPGSDETYPGASMAETEIGDLQASCRACECPPRYDDRARSARCVRERRGGARGYGGGW